MQVLRDALVFLMVGAMLFLTGARAAVWLKRSLIRRRTRARLYALVRL